jgi:alkanesulfonate monooxygenase SsuD/methylene tetrahydromethanopterin reductase-like flavin-dependent oxidoreductase (luciferase family)
MQVGIDSFAAAFDENSRTVDPASRMRHLIEQVVHADEVGLDVFGVGEHHRREFLDSAPAVILGAAAVRTERIRLTSAVTVLSAEDPVRAFQNFATIDLLSRGRAEMIVGRGSSIEAFPLFGYRLEDYDALFEEKLGLLLKIRQQERVEWSGRFRPALTGQGVYPRPVQQPLPIWLGVGGTPASFERAGALGLPLMVAIIGGEPMTDVGKERGWPPMTRARFDAQRGPNGALLVGSPDEVVDKILRHHQALGGFVRLSFMMNVASLPQARMMRAIDAIGARVAPALPGRG